MKTNRFYYVQIAKVVNSKHGSCERIKLCPWWGIFVHFLNSNWLIFKVFNSFGFMDFILVFSFVLFFDIYFSCKELLLINLNADKICCNFSYKNFILKCGNYHASGLWSFYSINFQIRQIPVKINIFPGNKNPFSIKPYCYVGWDSEKKTSIFPVWGLVSTR